MITEQEAEEMRNIYRIVNMTNKEEYVNFLREVFGSQLPAPHNYTKILYSSIIYAKECFCPDPNLLEIINASRDKKTGLSKMINIRTRQSKANLKKNVDKWPSGWNPSAWSTTVINSPEQINAIPTEYHYGQSNPITTIITTENTGNI